MAKVILTDGNLSGEGIFHFNEKGENVRFSAKRYYEEHLEKWTGYYYNYTMVDGFRIPPDVKVVWNLEDRDYADAKFHVIHMDYNTPTQYK